MLLGMIALITVLGLAIVALNVAANRYGKADLDAEDEAW